jgi:putative zinc finger protein
MAGCREIRQALGVYVLGAIDPAERAQVDEHLAVCPECREELASLAGLPAMLRKVPIIEVERLAASDQDPELAGVPSAQMLTSLIARTTNVRRIHRWRTLTAAAAVAIVALGGGAFVANALQPSAAPSNPGHTHSHKTVAWEEVRGTGPVAGAHLTVKYRHERWGTQMLVNVSGLQPGNVCQFQVVGANGGTSTVGSWVLWKDDSWYPASTWMGDSDVRGFQVTVNGKVVATAPADTS